MKTKRQAKAIVEALKEVYPVAECSLDYDSAWQLLVSVRLAAQCTDERVNKVTETLFVEYPTPKSLAEADFDQLEAAVHSCGLGRSKARDIIACMQVITEKYGGRVPDTMEELLKLPGVGRKSANLILGDIYKKPAIVADTHCIRLSNRIGFVESEDPYKVEMALRAVVAPEEGNDLCHRFVHHGRAICKARGPLCGACVLQRLCDTGKATLAQAPRKRAGKAAAEQKA